MANIPDKPWLITIVGRATPSPDEINSPYNVALSLLILSSDISPAMATSAALAAPSIILTAKADFFSGIIATKTPSAPFLINAFPIMIRLQS